MTISQGMKELLYPRRPKQLLIQLPINQLLIWLPITDLITDYQLKYWFGYWLTIWLPINWLPTHLPIIYAITNYQAGFYDQFITKSKLNTDYHLNYRSLTP